MYPEMRPRVTSDELNALFTSAWPDHRQTDMRPLLRCALTYVCAYADDRLVGFAKVIGDGGIHGFILDPTVAPDLQRKGIGRQLITRCIEESWLMGIKWLHVDFEPHLENFYRQCGFSPSRAGVQRPSGTIPA